jgi:transcriptional adapter 2-alpha
MTPVKSPPFETVPSHPSVHEVQGFMEKRFEFEAEHENEFENIIKDLSFNNDENPLEVEIKLALLEYYSDILDRRVERKKFIFNHDLLTDFKDILHSEKNKSSFLKDDKDLAARCCSLAGHFLYREDYETFSSGIFEEERLKKKIKMLQEYRRQGIRDFETARNYEKELSTKSQVTTPSILANIPQELTVVNNSSSSDPPARRSIAVPLDITDSEGIELLNPSERNLCSVLRILPKTYCNIKETLIAAYYKHGFLKRAQARSLIKIDVNKTSRIYDFFVTAGWIHPLPIKSDENK